MIVGSAFAFLALGSVCGAPLPADQAEAHAGETATVQGRASMDRTRAGEIYLDVGGTGENAPGWARLAWNYQNAMNTNRAENKDLSTTIAGAPNPSGIPYERYGDPAVKTYQTLLNFSYQITPNIELYGYLNGSKRDVTSNGYYRAFDSTRNVVQIYPNGFLPQIVNHSNDIATVVGVKGNTDPAASAQRLTARLVAKSASGEISDSRFA